MKKLIYVGIGLILALSACKEKNENSPQTDSLLVGKEFKIVDTLKYPVDKIKLPDGFKIDIYASGIKNARSMVLSENGIVYVGNREGGNVYAIIDEDKDFKADKAYVIASGLHMPNGVALKNGDLYVSEVSKIWKYKNIDQNYKNPPKPELIYDKYPTDDWHGWKFIAFGPDGKLYVPVGAPCNVCEKLDNPMYASITRMNADGSDVEIFASGIRNTVGFTWHPETKEMWFTDNGRDMMGDEIPSDELNHAPKAGMHFGFPYCHQGDIKDSVFGLKRPCNDFTPPAQKLGAHVASLGLRFYRGQMFPEQYKNQLFIAEHGSWNRTKKSGYNVTLVRLQDNKAVSHEIFASGWLDQKTDIAWGRPVDVLVMHDGSMLVSDDFANVIYRISYKK